MREVGHLLGRYALSLERLPNDSSITASYWGDPEAGLVGRKIFVRDDTPVHSLLHEMCHVICMTPARRVALIRDAGGDDLEEAAVCYLQVLLADELSDVGRKRLMRDMDLWGYSFRADSADCWFREDADDARAWLLQNGLITSLDRPSFRLRASVE